MNLFKARPLNEITDAELTEWGIPHSERMIEGEVIFDGQTAYITGCHEVNNEYTSADWWCPIDITTLKLTFEGMKLLYDNQAN